MTKVLQKILQKVTPKWLDNLTESQRGYYYRIGLALIGVLVAIGIIKEGDVPTWMNALGALLGITTTGLAVKNTSTKPPPEG